MPRISEELTIQNKVERNKGLEKLGPKHTNTQWPTHSLLTETGQTCWGAPWCTPTPPTQTCPRWTHLLAAPALLRQPPPPHHPWATFRQNLEPKVALFVLEMTKTSSWSCYSRWHRQDSREVAQDWWSDGVWVPSAPSGWHWTSPVSVFVRTPHSERE